jgi:four helix bundle protein
MADFKNLNVWQKAHQLTLDTFHACEAIKGSPATLVRDQLLRSVMSIASNIAEGSAKQSDREFARFVRISLGSSTESENHLLLAGDLGLIDQAAFQDLNKQVEDVRKMLNGLVKKLSADAAASARPLRRQQTAGSSLR